MTLNQAEDRLLEVLKAPSDPSPRRKTS